MRYNYFFTIFAVGKAKCLQFASKQLFEEKK